MEKIIGIFDEKIEYAERLKNYINENKEVGCFSIVFRQLEEVLAFCEKKKLSYLIIGEEQQQQVEQNLDKLSYGIKIWIVTEELSSSLENENFYVVFRYQKAKQLIQQILLSETTKIECLSMLYTIFSPENSQIAFSYGKKLMQKLAEQGKVLFLFWDAFSGYGREEEKNISISELLYLMRKDKTQARKLLEKLPKKHGVEYFCGPDYCTDLWQYSVEEMQQLIRYCQEYGGYQYVIFLAGIFHEGVIAVLNQSSKIYLISSETKEGQLRKQEFYRQMKYAGEQEILSKLIEVIER